MIRKMKDKLTKVVEKNKICYEIRRRRPEKEKVGGLVVDGLVASAVLAERMHWFVMVPAATSLVVI